MKHSLPKINTISVPSKRTYVRLSSVDTARAIAICTVVFIHASEKTRPIASWTLLDNILVPLFTTIGRIGVPVFLILTGFLVLPRLNKSGVRRFYRRNFLPLAVSFEIWNLAVFIVRRFIASDNSLTFRQYVLASLLIGKEIDVPLWYIDSFFLCISFYRS